MPYLLSGLIGAIIGSIISGVVAYKIYTKQLLSSQYLTFVDELDKALIYHKLLKSEEIDKAKKKSLKVELELSLNKAWSKALVTLPDNIFYEIDKVFQGKEWTRKSEIEYIFC